VVDKLSRDELASSYGFALSFMQSDPELFKLFNQAVKQTWTADRFVAKMRGTKWFQHHSANVRNAILQQTSDPETYNAAVDQMYSTVRDAWGSMFGNTGNDKQMRQWAETAHRMGWSQAQLMDRMTKGVDYQKMLKNKNLGGTAAETDAQLDQLSAAYGLNVGKGWKANQVKKLVSGDDTIQGVQNRLRELAMREYAAFADDISGGSTVADIADPYIQRMADLLEVSPESIQVKDKMIQKALRQKAPDGKPAAASLSEFEDMVRQDHRWQYTENAREQMAGVTAQIAQAFGQVSA
jgi:hypothetical protein